MLFNKTKNQSMFFTSNALYSTMELYKAQLLPIRISIKSCHEMFSDKLFFGNGLGKNFKAFFEVLERLTRTYDNKAFNISSTLINNKSITISEKIALDKPFCELLHFKKLSKTPNQPKLLIVAPLAGHHSSLLTESVTSLLPFFDVYVTNWKDAAEVPLQLGKFDMNDYINYIIQFIKHLGHSVNIMAVCQPAVPVLAATSILSEENSPYVPDSLTLMGGPIDARINPTEVNKFALKYNIDWFENYMISTVPANYPGFMRKVYPGFLQLLGFVNMNLEKHISSHVGLFEDLITNNIEEAEKQKKFYDRYFSVIDLSAEFYLQTIKEIFQDFSLAKGTLVSDGRKINLANIKKSALFCIEGEHDDITGIGQTKAALDLCSNVASDKKQYHLQEGAGHYGIFSGGKFRRNIAPMITDFINTHSQIKA
jgi:poly(3-hydroxybutyrate) depolymerase